MPPPSAADIQALANLRLAHAHSLISLVSQAKPGIETANFQHREGGGGGGGVGGNNGLAVVGGEEKDEDVSSTAGLV